MCGIAGFTRVAGSGPLNPRFVAYFSSVLHAISARGADSFGIGIYHHAEEVFVLKHCEPPLRIDYALDEIAALYDRRMARLGEAGYVLAGFRGVPVTEAHDYTDDACVQPYHQAGSAVTHNGIIANDKQLAAVHGHAAPVVDSYILLDHFAAAPPEDTAARLRELVSGSAFALYSAPRDELLLARNFRGLALAVWCEHGVRYGDAQVYVVWASEEIALKVAAADRHATVVTAEMPAWSYLRLTPDLCPRDMSPSFYLGMLLDHCLRFAVPQGSDSCAVVLSGGLDSTTVATLACHQFRRVHLLHFAYGARAQPRERAAVEAIHDWLADNTPVDEIKLHVIDLSFLKQLGGSTLTDHSRELSHGGDAAEADREWVPARNTALIALAAAYCDRHAIGNIALGLNMEEGSVYRDNSQEFCARFEAALELGTRSAAKLWMPLVNSMKHQILAMALDIDAPVHLSWSCYTAGPKPCGRCGSCILRRGAYAMNNLEDPAEYEYPLPAE